MANGNLTADGSVDLESEGVRGCLGGAAFNTLTVVGTWGGASLKYQILGANGSTYIDVATLTTNGYANVQVRGRKPRLNLSGATVTNLYWEIL